MVREEIRSDVFGFQIFEKGNSDHVGDIGVADHDRVLGNILCPPAGRMVVSGFIVDYILRDLSAVDIFCRAGT